MTSYAVPILNAFRDAYEAGDAKKRIDDRNEQGERVLSKRGAARRHGSDEKSIRSHLSTDLGKLFNTINLESAIDLEDCGFVRKSVLNFGLHDISHITSEEERVEIIVELLKRSLLSHERRLISDTLVVSRNHTFDEVNQRIEFRVEGEFTAEPFDIPVEFVAEVDICSAKFQVKKLP